MKIQLGEEDLSRYSVFIEAIATKCNVKEEAARGSRPSRSDPSLQTQQEGEEQHEGLFKKTLQPMLDVERQELCTSSLQGNFQFQLKTTGA